MVLIIPKEIEQDWASEIYGTVNWQTASLVEMLQHRAKNSPSLSLFTFLNGDCDPIERLTSEELDQQASSIAAGLHHFGKAGQRVLILCDNDPSYIQALFGILYAGMIPVSGVHLDVVRSNERFEMVAGDAQPHMIIGPRKILMDYQVEYKKLDWNPRWVPLEVLLNVKDQVVIHSKNDDIALIQYTSGTTKSSKGIELTNRNFLYNLRYQAESHEVEKKGQEYTGLGWLPFAHDLGLIAGILLPIAFGSSGFYLSPKLFIEKPMRWLRALSRYSINFSGGPTFAFNLCAKEATDEDLKELDLSHWRTVLNGADTAQTEVIERFCKKFAPVGFKARNFVFGYGLAEATLTVTRTKRFVTPKIRSFSRRSLVSGFANPSMDKFDKRILISCGSPFADQKLKIVDPETCQPLRNGRVGEIWLAGESIAKGYFNRPEETEEVFHAKLPDDPTQYLRTGDLGFILGDELYFSGRISNVIHLQGRQYDPDDICGQLEAVCSDIRSHSVAFFLRDEEDLSSITVIIELSKKSVMPHDEILNKAYEVITKIYDIWPKFIILTRPGGVLKTPSGKIQISRTRKALHDNALPIIRVEQYDVPPLPPKLTFDEALKDVKIWIAEATKDWQEDITQLTREQLIGRNIDSESLLSLRNEFERKFRIQIDPFEFMVACQNYNELCEVLSKKISDPL